jgi:hypothetical protein
VTWDDEDDAPSRRSTTTTTRHIPFFPVLLIAFGAAALLHQMVGRGVSVFPLAIGIYLIARSRSTPGGHYPLLVVGAVLTGSGAGNLFGDLFAGGASNAFGTLGTAAGFFWLYTIDRGRSSWAIVPSAIVGLIGVGELGFHLTDLMRGGTAGWLLPAGVVVAGVLLLGAHRLPGPLRLAGLVFVGAAALSLVTNSPDNPRRRAPVTVTTGSAANTVGLGDIVDRTVTFTGGSGDVSVEIGVGEASGAHLRVVESSSNVTITTDRPSEDIKLTVPEGTKLRLQTSSGDIDIGVATADAVVTTSSGDVNIAVAGNPTVTLATSSGDLENDGFESDVSNSHLFVHKGDGGQVVVTTSSGDVDLARQETDASAPVGAR